MSPVALNFQQVGSGPPLVILHGLFGSLDNWRSLAHRIGKHFSVFSVDLRNHGRSPHAAPHSMAALALDLAQLFERQAIAPAVLVGHSMGGKAAVTFARDFPQHVAKLIVVDMGIRQYPPGHEEVFNALLAVDFAQHTTRETVDAALAEYLPDSAVRQFLLKGLTRAEGGFRWRFNLPQLHQDYPHLLAAVEVPKPLQLPTLFIRGARSSYLTDTDLKELAVVFPKMMTTTVPAGHWVHAEAPEATLQALGSFLGVAFA